MRMKIRLKMAQPTMNIAKVCVLTSFLTLLSKVQGCRMGQSQIPFPRKHIPVLLYTRVFYLLHYRMSLPRPLRQVVRNPVQRTIHPLSLPHPHHLVVGSLQLRTTHPLSLPHPLYLVAVSLQLQTTHPLSLPHPHHLVVVSLQL